jgi:hypothetical protein
MTAGHCSGGRDQEDCGWKPAQANSWRDPISKKTYKKSRAAGVAQGVGLEFKPSTAKKKKWVYKQSLSEGVV